MTLPASGALSLAQLEAEFGLAAGSVFPNAYWGKGGLPASGALVLPNDFWGRSNISYNIPGGSYEHYVTSGTAICTIAFQRNGTISSSAGVGYSGSWVTPNNSTIGDAYDISFDNGGSWLQLNTQRTVSVSKAAGTGTNSSTINCKIRRRSDSVQVASGTFTINATRDTA